ncbi:SCP2 sterol-binding domain-containing protein [Alicyclobacillus tolerans]|uniref:SCP2 sterol-binding domain-containing protein n=1 Tax=Alicyclobacillus tolerans TaxID=90970 RepID=UPI001F235471|nr:SCP2 sterol-binding domain-containing protein [Alicyclobacillus tolerans]MCF8566943.1 SCP2 sterol-binding domain-containing protein [Alicyclobacillus tolerans]
MPTTKEIFEKINDSLSSDPAKAAGINAVYQFNLTGEDEGVYQVVLRPDGAYAVEGQPESSNCTLEMAASDFKDMVEGKLNGTAAFMSGKLKVNGDMGLALRLQTVLQSYTA